MNCSGTFSTPPRPRLPSRRQCSPRPPPLLPSKRRGIPPSSRPAQAAPHPPIPVRFALLEPGYVTLVIEAAASGTRVRNLVSETHFEAGANVAWWDGLDDLGRDPTAAGHFTYSIPGKLVTPGRYRVRGLVRPELELRYQMSAYNSATVPWQTKDRASEWLANHTPPAAVLFVPPGAAPDRPGHPAPGGQVLVGSFVSEGGSGLAWLDADEGRKVHGQLWIGGVWTGATALARDEGEHSVPGVYAYAGSAWVGDESGDFRPELRLFALTKPDPASKTKGPADARFGTGEDAPLLEPTYKLPAGLEVKEHENLTPLGGLAAHDGLVVASITPTDLLLFVDAADHRTLATAALERPRGLAFDPQGRLLAVSGRRVVRMAVPSLPKDTPTTRPVELPRPEALVDSGLDDPQQLALGPDGKLYVSDRGDSHQVKVFSPDGKPLRTIGKPGRPGVGPYDPDHMNNPYGLTIDGRGRLWVAEQDKTPKRLSVWSTSDGKLVKAFYGPPQYGGGGEVDSQDATRFFYADDGGMELKLNWQAGTSVPVALYYRRDTEISSNAAPGYNAGQPPQTPIHANGKTYLVDCFNSNPTGGIASSTVWLLDGGVARRVAVVGRANDWPEFNPTAAFSVRWSGRVVPRYDESYRFIADADDGVRLWVDGQLLIDHWKANTGAPIPVGRIALKANTPVELKMEYFQKGGSAAATLLWESPGEKRQVVPADRLVPAGGGGHGLTGEYFSDPSLKMPLTTRVDPTIEFHWGTAGFKVGNPPPLAAKLPAGADLGKAQVTFAWSDVNGDGRMQPDEVTCVAGDPIGVAYMSDLTAVTAGGIALRPKGFAPAGAALRRRRRRHHHARLPAPDQQRRRAGDPRPRGPGGPRPSPPSPSPLSRSAAAAAGESHLVLPQPLARPARLARGPASRAPGRVDRHHPPARQHRHPPRLRRRRALRRQRQQGQRLPLHHRRPVRRHALQDSRTGSWSFPEADARATDSTTPACTRRTSSRRSRRPPTARST